TYHGDYSGRRHSALTAITSENVHQPTLASSFQSGQSDSLKAMPILRNAGIYVTTPDNIWAVDARSGRQIWKYSYPKNSGFHIGHRCAALHREEMYLTTP